MNTTTCMIHLHNSQVALTYILLALSLSTIKPWFCSRQKKTFAFKSKWGESRVNEAKSFFCREHNHGVYSNIAYCIILVLALTFSQRCMDDMVLVKHNLLYNLLIYLIIQSTEHGRHGPVGRGVVEHVEPAYHIDNVLVAILHQLVMDVVVLEIQKMLNNVRQQSVQVNVKHVLEIFDLVRTNLLTFYLLSFAQNIDYWYKYEPPL